MKDVKDFPVNATIVSFLPLPYNPYLPGLLPAFFEIPAAERDDFVVVPITDCLCYVYVLDGKSIPTMISGIEVAGSIANDYISASIHTGPGAFPGIKSIPGNHSKDKIKEMFPEELAGLALAQKNWFSNLVKIADDIWSDPQARGKQQSISDIQRIAAKQLGLNREWLTAIVLDNVECFACGFNIKASALICINCKTVLKPEEYKRFTSGTLSAETVKTSQPVEG